MDPPLTWIEPAFTVIEPAGTAPVVCAVTFVFVNWTEPVALRSIAAAVPTPLDATEVSTVAPVSTRFAAVSETFPAWPLAPVSELSIDVALEPPPPIWIVPAGADNAIFPAVAVAAAPVDEDFNVAPSSINRAGDPAESAPLAVMLMSPALPTSDVDVVS
jgi:hypothetical protein